MQGLMTPNRGRIRSPLTAPILCEVSVSDVWGMGVFNIRT